MYKSKRSDKFLGLLILSLFILGGYLEGIPDTPQKAPVTRQAVLYSATPVYTFPAYRTIEAPPTKKPVKKPVKKKSPVISKSSRGSQVKTYTVTAYCEGTVNAAGETPKIGTIAAPRAIPLGTKVKIKGKIYVVKDRTHERFDYGLNNSATRWDIYMGNGEFEKCIQWGKQVLKVEVID